jgi:hypothetical protein
MADSGIVCSKGHSVEHVDKFHAEVPFGTLRLSDCVNMSEIAVSFFGPFSLLHPLTLK